MQNNRTYTNKEKCAIINDVIMATKTMEVYSRKENKIYHMTQKIEKG